MQNNQFLRPITNGLIDLSAALLSISKCPSSRIKYILGSKSLAYSSALPNELLGNVFSTSSFTKHLNSSKIGFRLNPIDARERSRASLSFSIGCIN